MNPTELTAKLCRKLL